MREKTKVDPLLVKMGSLDSPNIYGISPDP